MDWDKWLFLAVAVSHHGEAPTQESKKFIPLDPHPTHDETITPMAGRNLEFTFSGVGSQAHGSFLDGGVLYLNPNRFDGSIIF